MTTGSAGADPVVSSGPRHATSPPLAASSPGAARAVGRPLHRLNPAKQAVALVVNPRREERPIRRVSKDQAPDTLNLEGHAMLVLELPEEAASRKGIDPPIPKVAHEEARNAGCLIMPFARVSTPMTE